MITACDFFTVEVFTPTGLVAFYVLIFVELGSRKIHIAGVTPHDGRGSTTRRWASRF